MGDLTLPRTKGQVNIMISFEQIRRDCKQGLQQCDICLDKGCSDNMNPDAKNRVDSGPFWLSADYRMDFPSGNVLFYWDATQDLYWNASGDMVSGGLWRGEQMGGRRV